ncbi:MAG: VOC family protein [Defluviitaleaceae bacterium]|nr:VOC family protein [Defluviitaleaceae bacterium]
MSKITPILIFAGQANQAIELYTKAFGANVIEKIFYSDANPKDLGIEDKDKYKDSIFWSELKIGDQLISLADDSNAIKNGIKGISGNSFLIDLLVHFDSDDELKAAYETLSDGATITVPLCSQTYCSLTCALIDKFGGRWQLMSGYKG